MGASVKELVNRCSRANNELRSAFKALLLNDGKDIDESAPIPGRTFLAQFEFTDQSLPGIPGAFKRLVKSAYTQPLPIWAVRIALACDPEAELPDGEIYALQVDLVVREPKVPSQIASNQGKIAVGKIESFLQPVVMIFPDTQPMRYMVERTPIMTPKNGVDPNGTHIFGHVGPAVIEGTTEVISRYQKYLNFQTETQFSPTQGRAQRAVSAFKRAVYPRIGRPTATPGVRFESFTPPALLFP